MACFSNSCGGSSNGGCPDKFGCYPNIPVDFCIKRHDTSPAFKVVVADCDGPIDLTGLVLEVSMWAKAKLKKDIAASDTELQFADNIGFEQVAVGDIILMQRVRAPEQMLVTDFDEINYKVVVQRGYHGTPVSTFKKGTPLKIFRVLNAPATTEMDMESADTSLACASTESSNNEETITESRLVYSWSALDTCLPGCYYLEFKLLTLTSPTSDPTLNPSPTPSQTGSYTDFQMGCSLGLGIASVSRYPRSAEGYLIKIIDSPTSENVF